MIGRLKPLVIVAVGPRLSISRWAVVVTALVSVAKFGDVDVSVAETGALPEDDGVRRQPSRGNRDGRRVHDDRGRDCR